MADEPTYYDRGGASLSPRLRIDVRINPQDGLLKTERGVSVYDRPDHPNLVKRGGVYRLGSIPEGLQVRQVGKDASHHEVVPARSMSFDDYRDLLAQITLTQV